MSKLQTPPSRPRLRDLWPDLLCFAAIAAFWLIAVRPVIIDEHRRGWDVNRDAAAATNILNGQWLADPAYAGYGLWYPPLSPALVAFVSNITDIAPIEVYRYSAFWVNWMIPVGLFLLVRCAWNRKAAILATTALLLAIPWWQKEVHLGQASIQAVIGGWIAVWLYAIQYRRQSMIWAALCGAFQGLAFWHHPFVPAVLAGAFILQSLWEIKQFPAHCAGIIRRNAVILVVTVLVAAPVLYLMMHGPILNLDPREYLAPELEMREFALMNGNPWIWATGILGLIFCIRKRCFGCRVLLGVVTLTALAQIPGYLRIWVPHGAAGLPMVVPHEFQLLFQLGWAILVGLGAAEVLRWLQEKVFWLRASPAAGTILFGIALLATGLHGLVHVRENLRHFLNPYDIPAPLDEAAVWIRANTKINDVFACDPATAFSWMGPATGRKTWLTQSGHSNPRVDWEFRRNIFQELAVTDSPQHFWELMNQYKIDYCIINPNWNPRVFQDKDLKKEMPRYMEMVSNAQNVVPIFKRLPPSG